MGRSNRIHSAIFTLVIMAILILLITLPVSAADVADTGEQISTNSMSVEAASDIARTTDSNQILPNGVYRIYNQNNFKSLMVEGYGITNNTNVMAAYGQIYDFDDTMEKNALWLLTHISNDKYTLRPIHKPNMALDYTSSNVGIYGIGIDYSYSLESTKWKISASSDTQGYIVQNNGLASRTLTMDQSTGNVYTVNGYSGITLERWCFDKLSDTEVASLEGIIVYGNTAVKVGNLTQLTAGVFSTSTLNQSATYSSSYIGINVSSNGAVAGVSEGIYTVAAVSSADSSVRGTTRVAVSSENRKTATLIGIPSSEGGTHNHTSYFSMASSSIRGIYGTNASISTYTSIDSGDKAAIYLMNSDVTVYRGHGTATYIIFGDDNMHSPIMGNSNLGSGEGRTLSNSDLILYCCCLCGQGGATGNNLVVATYRKGAKNVIGFKVEINCSDANSWTDNFLNRLNGFSSGGAITADAIRTTNAWLDRFFSETDLKSSNRLFMTNN